MEKGGAGRKMGEDSGDCVHHLGGIDAPRTGGTAVAYSERERYRAGTLVLSLNSA